MFRIIFLTKLIYLGNFRRVSVFETTGLSSLSYDIFFALRTFHFYFLHSHNDAHILISKMHLAMALDKHAPSQSEPLPVCTC